MRHKFVVVAALCLSVGAAQAAFVAYNDCAWQTGQALPANVTAITGTGSGNGSTSGMLKDFGTGTSTGVTMTLSWISVSWNLGQANSVSAGTDAKAVFDGTTVDLNGVGAYKDSAIPSSAQVTFTGLDPAKEYEFVTTANRSGGSSYADRYTKFTIQDADAFNNASSSGVIIRDSGASATFVTGENSAKGYVARWTGIRPGADGDFTVWSGNPDAVAPVVLTTKPYVIQAFRLTEIPEPASLGLLSLGGLVVAAYRRR